MESFNDDSDLHLNLFDKKSIELFTEAKILTYIIFGAVMLILFGISMGITIYRELSIKILCIIILLIHTLLIALSGLSLYNKEESAQVYIFVIIVILVVHLVTIAINLQIYKKERDSIETRDSRRQRISQLTITLFALMSGLNIVWAHRTITYILNIIISVGGILAFFFINRDMLLN